MWAIENRKEKKVYDTSYITQGDWSVGNYRHCGQWEIMDTLVSQAVRVLKEDFFYSITTLQTFFSNFFFHFFQTFFLTFFINFLFFFRHFFGILFSFPTPTISILAFEMIDLEEATISSEATSAVVVRLRARRNKARPNNIFAPGLEREHLT